MSKGKIITGIDIGTDKICTVIAIQSPETERTNVVGVASTPSKGVRKSQIVDLEEAIGAITDSVEAAERMAGLNINQAYLSVSGAHISSQNSKGVVAVSEPEGEIIPEDVKRVIEAASAVSLGSNRSIIHVIPRDYTVDSQPGIKDPVGMTGVRLEAEAHLITGAATSIKNIQKCSHELGIELQSLVFSGLASAQAVLTETEKELGVILIDIGGGTTSAAIYNEGSLAHSFVIPVGAKNVTNDLAIGLRLSLANAEKIKIHLSKGHEQFTPPPNSKASEIARLRKQHDTLDLAQLGIKEEATTTSKKALVDGIIKPRLYELFDLIAEEIKKNNLENTTPAGVVLTGGGAETVGVRHACKRILNVPVRIGTPKSLTGLVDELAAPAYATATGLIHYGINDYASPRASSGPDIGGLMNRLPSKAIATKLIDLIKSVLP